MVVKELVLALNMCEKPPALQFMLSGNPFAVQLPHLRCKYKAGFESKFHSYPPHHMLHEADWAFSKEFYRKSPRILPDKFVQMNESFVISIGRRVTESARIFRRPRGTLVVFVPDEKNQPKSGHNPFMQVYERLERHLD